MRTVARWMLVVLALIAVASLIDSYFHDVRLEWQASDRTTWVMREGGWFAAATRRQLLWWSGAPQPGFDFEYEPVGTQTVLDRFNDRNFEMPGFWVLVDPGYWSSNTAFAFSHWLLTVPLLIAAVWGWFRLRARPASHVCAACGYDRRGLKLDRPCPECGKPGPSAAQPRD